MLPLLLVVVLATPQPSPSSEPLKTIETVRSTSFCGEIATHVNAAIDAATGNDARLGSLITGLRNPDMAGNVLQRRNERIRLDNVASAMYKTYRAGEDEVGHLRALAKSATDKEQKKDLEDTADALGGVLYRQHLIQRDTDGFLAFLDAGEMIGTYDDARKDDEIQMGGGGVDPRTGLPNPQGYWIPRNVPFTVSRDLMRPGDESPLDDLRMAQAASLDFQTRLPAILTDELTAGGHVSAVSDKCQ